VIRSDSFIERETFTKIVLQRRKPGVRKPGFWLLILSGSVALGVLSVKWGDSVNGAGAVCDQKPSKFFVSSGEESITGHMDVNKS
jgi:hypothetical protein